MPGVFPISDLSGGTGYPWLPPQYNPTLANLGYATGPKPTTPAPAVTTPAGATATGGGSFDINPPGQVGSGSPFGGVPGPIQYPTTPYKEATNIYAGLPGLTDAAGRATLAQINADFTPEMTANLWNIANTYGVQSGMPGADIWKNKFFGNQIDKMLAERQKGLGNYNALLAELGRMGVDPNLAAQIADRNATYRVAPTNPTQALMDLFGAYANRGANAGRSPAGGTGAYMNPYFNQGGARSPAAGTIAPPIAPPAATTRPNAGTGTYNLEMYPSEEEQAFLDEIAPRPGMYNWNSWDPVAQNPNYDFNQPTAPYGGIDLGDYNVNPFQQIPEGTWGDIGNNTMGLGPMSVDWFGQNQYFDPLLEFDDSEFWGGGY